MKIEIDLSQRKSEQFVEADNGERYRILVRVKKYPSLESELQERIEEKEKHSINHERVKKLIKNTDNIITDLEAKIKNK